SHSVWLQAMFEAEGDGLTIVADIDAFPLSRAAFERLLEPARAGGVAGLAQVANHKNPDRLYAGPMFLAAGRDVYRALGRPAMARWDKGDVAQALTDAADAQGVPVSLTYPSFAIRPEWALAQRGVFGIGTFYGDLEFFHLFQSRKRNSMQLFVAVAEDVIAGRYDFARYIEIMRPRKWFGLI
ncbi:MAG: hypothetical protein ACK4GT_08600, partial [Pararhodobacter sp.]